MNTFREQQGFPADLALPTAFEHFANFCIASKEYSDGFDVEDVHVAGGNDLQLDPALNDGVRAGVLPSKTLPAGVTWEKADPLEARWPETK